MPDAPTAYPLQWPLGYPRTPADSRRHAKFNAKRTEHRTLAGGSSYSYVRTVSLTIVQAIERLESELDKIGAELPVLSTNLELRISGVPRSGQREPDDPGAAVYFRLWGRPVCLPCDKYSTTAGNIAAIAAHIEATRAIERHGVASIEEMFAGFTAIRGPGPKPWREVLGFKLDQGVTREMVQAKRRELAARNHPDAGGSDAAMAEINAAADRALEELRG